MAGNPYQNLIMSGFNQEQQVPQGNPITPSQPSTDPDDIYPYNPGVYPPPFSPNKPTFPNDAWRPGLEIPGITPRIPGIPAPWPFPWPRPESGPGYGPNNTPNPVPPTVRPDYMNPPTQYPYHPSQYK